MDNTFLEGNCKVRVSLFINFIFNFISFEYVICVILNTLSHAHDYWIWSLSNLAGDSNE